MKQAYIKHFFSSLLLLATTFLPAAAMDPHISGNEGDKQIQGPQQKRRKKQLNAISQNGVQTQPQQEQIQPPHVEQPITSSTSTRNVAIAYEVDVDTLLAAAGISRQDLHNHLPKFKLRRGKTKSTKSSQQTQAIQPEQELDIAPQTAPTSATTTTSTTTATAMTNHSEINEKLPNVLFAKSIGWVSVSVMKNGTIEVTNQNTQTKIIMPPISTVAQVPHHMKPITAISHTHNYLVLLYHTFHPIDIIALRLINVETGSESIEQSVGILYKGKRGHSTSKATYIPGHHLYLLENGWIVHIGAASTKKFNIILCAEKDSNALVIPNEDNILTKCSIKKRTRLATIYTYEVRGGTWGYRFTIKHNAYQASIEQIPGTFEQQPNTVPQSLSPQNTLATSAQAVQPL